MALLSPAMSPTPPTVCVVDNDGSVSRATHRLLTAAGIRTRTFDSAEALLDSGSVDEAACLVLDVNLPGLSGFALASQLQGRGVRPPPVVFITGLDQPGYAAEAERHHALAYLTKPFEGRDLLAAVRSAIDRLDPPPDP